MEKGFIKLHRKFFSNELWTEARAFSSCEAWLDLIQSARFDATPHTESIGGREISYTRGQFPASIRFLAKRWRWSERNVRSFIGRLRRKGMITTGCDQGMQIITLRKYEEYNACEAGDDTATRSRQIVTQPRHSVTKRTARPLTHPRHTGDTNSKKEKKEEEIINFSSTSLENPFDEFWNLYDKKISRTKCEKKWNALTDEERALAMNYLPGYVRSQPDKQFRKHPETFLNQKAWNDELIFSRPVHSPYQTRSDEDTHEPLPKSAGIKSIRL